MSRRWRRRVHHAELLLLLEKVSVGVTVAADGLRHRIVGLDEQISVIVPRKRFDAVRHLNVWLRAKVILADPRHLVAVHLHRDHLDLEDGLEHAERLRSSGIEAALLLRTNWIEHADLARTDRAPRCYPLVLL